MIRRVGKYLLWATVMAVFALVGVMAFMRRDHKVELVVTYPQSPPAAIWRLLTDHAAEPRWLPSFGSVVRQPDIGGHEVWTHTSPDKVFRFTVMTVSRDTRAALRTAAAARRAAAEPIVGRTLDLRTRTERQGHPSADHRVWLD
jgi:hypothetical protein